MAGKFYWLKLKEDFFQQEAIEWLEEQENGKEYSLLYLKLCLKSLKDNGVLVRRIGTKNIPYSVEKIADMTNTNATIVEQALNLFIEIGLLTKQENKVLLIPGLASMVGSESDNPNAIRQKRFRDKKKAEAQAGVTKSVTNSNAMRNDMSNGVVTERNATSNANCVTKNNVEIRDKRLEIRDKNISLSFSPSCHGVTHNIVQLYEQKIGLLNGRIAEQLANLLELYGEERVIKGINITYERGARTFGYLAKCVECPLPEKPARQEMPF